MSRYRTDEVRSAETASTTTRDGRDLPSRDRPVVRPLPERVARRTHERGTDGRTHHLTLPSGPQREPVRGESRLYQLRGSESDLLERAGRYRVVFADDLRGDAGADAQFREDLRSLERQGLMEERTVTRLADGKVADVVSVTRAGKALLDHHRDPDQGRGQQYYGGRVKPGEVWHDASLFRMVREVEGELARDAEQVRRVILDDELKARAYRALNTAPRDGGPDPDQDHRETIAAVHGLHLEDGRFVFPDVRLEIEDQDGTVRSLDLELVTEHYHRGHLGGKARAGFRMFGGTSSSRGGMPYSDRTAERVLR
jgi:hypothetical protein